MFKGLYLDGTGWATTTNPDITGDLTVVAEFWKEEWNSGTNEIFASVYETDSDQRSWVFDKSSTDDLRLRINPDGTGPSNTEHPSGNPIPSSLLNGNFFAVKVELDVDPGTITFYTAETKAGPWDTLDIINLGGVVSLFSSSAPLAVGVRNSENFDNQFDDPLQNSVVKSLEVYAGISTNIQIDVRFENEVRGTTTFTDEQANTWTLSDNAVIVDGQTPELGLWLPDSIEEANEWAVADTPGTISKVNAELIDAFIGDLTFNEQDAVIQNSQGEGPFDADDSQKVRWRIINGFVFAIWDIHFGGSNDVNPTGFIELELPVEADTSFHEVSNELSYGDIIGEGFLYNGNTSGDSELCNVQLRSSTRIRMPIETGNPVDYLTGDDPWAPTNSDAWNVHAIYKAAS